MYLLFGRTGGLQGDLKPYFLNPFVGCGASWLFPQLGYCE
jgi:hypothetical protein